MTESLVQDVMKTLTRIVDTYRRGEAKVEAIHGASRGRNPLVTISVEGTAPVAERLKLDELIAELNATGFKVSLVQTRFTISGQMEGKNIHFDIQSDEKPARSESH